MQLTSDSVPKPSSSELVADSGAPQTAILDVGDEEGRDQIEEGVVSEELAGLFSGMAISGEKAPRPARPTQPVQPVRRVKPSPPRVKKQPSEEASAFGDLLGLVCG